MYTRVTPVVGPNGSAGITSFGMPAQVRTDWQPTQSSAVSVDDVLGRLAQEHQQHVKAKFNTPMQNRAFQSVIDEHMGVQKRGKEMMRMLNDAEFSTAADCRERDPGKRAYVPDAQGKAVMESAQHVAKGGKLTAQDARIIRTPAQVIESVAASLRTEFPALEDTATSRAFTRKLRKLCDQPTDGVYTDFEYDNAVTDRIVDQTVTMSALEEKYGPSPKTIQRGVSKVLTYIAYGPTVRDQNGVNLTKEQQASSTEKAMDLGRDGVLRLMSLMREQGLLARRGAQPLLSVGEAAAIIGKAMLAADMGRGQSQEFVRATMAKACRTEGTRQLKQLQAATQQGKRVSDQDRKRAQRLSKAVICKKTYRKTKQRINASGVLGDADGRMVCDLGKGKKTSKLSQARAGTNALVLTEKMFEQIRKTIQTMVDEGALTNPHNRPLEDLLEPHQIMNGDEVGFDPEGCTGRVECFTGRRNMQSLTTSEHAAFWCTVFSVTKADGTLLPPVVLHQGVDNELSQASCSLGDAFTSDPAITGSEHGPPNVPRDWMVRQSSSGYMTEEIWMDVANHIILNCPRANGPYLLYIDGHGSHWNEKALRKLKDHGIYVCFLRSHNSEQDQPNDNGFNSRQKSVYYKKLTEWKIKYPHRITQKFKAWHFNEVYHMAWQELIGSSGEVIRNGFKICGLFPLDKSVAMNREGAQSTGTWAHQVEEQQPLEFLKKILPAPATFRKVEDGSCVVPAVVMTLNEDKSSYNLDLTSHISGTPLQSKPNQCVLRLGIADALQGEAMASANVLAAQSEMRTRKSTKISLDGVRMMCTGQACTREGLAVTDHVLEQLAKSRKLGEEAAAEKAQRSADLMKKRQAKEEEARNNAEEVRTAWEKGANLEGFKVSLLQDAAHVLAGAQKGLKKQDCIDALNAWKGTQEQGRQNSA